MLRTALCIFSLVVSFLSPARGENPWGLECATLDECLTYLTKTRECAPNDNQYQCFFKLNNDGLGNEIAKFGRSAVPPLLEMVNSHDTTLAARAVDQLWQLQDQVWPEERKIVLDAWRRDVFGAELLAARFATPDFVREVMELLRDNPVDEGRVWNTFNNFRDWDDQPNGIHATISEHIECSEREPCEPRFAKLQFDWLVSNTRREENIASRIMQAIKNPELDTRGRLAALQFFSPSEYSRTKAQLMGVAVPFLRKILTSKDREASIEAANILAAFTDASAIETLVANAADQSAPPAGRTRALLSLARYPHHDKQTLAMLKALLNDADWDVRRKAVILLGATGGESATDELIGQIGPHDWLTSYSAVSALRDMPNKNASAALSWVAANYWHPIVREAAKMGMSRPPNLQQYPASERTAVDIASTAAFSMTFPAFDRQEFEILSWCKARFKEDGYRFVPDFITGPDVVVEMSEASSFNERRFRNSLLRLEVMNDAKPPGRDLTFGGWTFAGSTSEDGSGRLLVSRPESPSQTLVAKNIVAVFLWNGWPHAITGSSGSYPQGDGFLLKLFQNANLTWSAKQSLRLTGVPEVWLAPDQTIGILGGGGVMLIRPDGTPEWIGCPLPSFP